MNAPTDLSHVLPDVTAVRETPAALIDALKALFGDRCSTALSVRTQHGRDESSFDAPPPSMRFSTRASTNSRSLSRFRYCRGASLTSPSPLARPSATTARSARRATVRLTCASEAARVPAGRMNSASRGSAALCSTSALSICSSASGLSSV